MVVSSYLRRILRCIVVGAIYALTAYILLVSLLPQELNVSLIIITVLLFTIYLLMTRSNEVLVIYVIYVMYFMPHLVAVVIPSLYIAVVKFDELILNKLLTLFTNARLGVEGLTGYLFFGSEAVARYSPACSSLRVMMFVIPPLLLKNESLGRRVATSLVGLLLATVANWGRVIAIVLMSRTLGIFWSHIIVGSITTTIISLMILIIQATLSKEYGKAIVRGAKRMDSDVLACLTRLPCPRRTS